ncbi:MAG: hypothetical protein FWG40_00395 [Peptococcaceae bacterium]|nr:hypothetical protein [Peptococcaceae bacterium]
MKKRFLIGLCLGLVLMFFPAGTLSGEEIMGREIKEFSGILKNSVPVEHNFFVGTHGTTTLTLSFIGGSSSILLEVFDSDSQCVYQKQTPIANKMMINHLEMGGYLLRMTSIQKTPGDLPYQLEILMPKKTYLTLEDERIPLIAPSIAITEDGTVAAESWLKPIPFGVYIVFLCMVLWGWVFSRFYRRFKNN